MVSVKDLEIELETLQASCQDARPLLVKYLPQDEVGLDKADSLLVQAKRSLEKVVCAEE